MNIDIGYEDLPKINLLLIFLLILAIAVNIEITIKKIILSFLWVSCILAVVSITLRIIPDRFLSINEGD